MKRLYTVLAALALALSLHAQQPWEKARALYRQGFYSEAMAVTEGRRGEMEEGYYVLSAQAAGIEGSSERARVYLDRYPESVLVPQVHYALGLSLFEGEHFDAAMREFETISQEDLYPSQVAEYAYKLGYSAYGAGEWERAKQLLGRARGLPYSDFTAPSYYSLGYINYAQGNFKDASQWFELAAHDHRFAALANYYILECRFNLKDYAYVVKFGEGLFEKVPSERQPHMARIMSESYLVLGDVEKARTYYERNLRNNRSVRTRSDYFYAGEMSYLAEDWQGAVDNFMCMEDRADSLGQVANYQMGYSYVKLRNKVAAMQAFKDASIPSFTPAIQEDAFFNYAKLAFDLGRDTAPFQEYLSRFDARSKGDRIYSYMAMVALQNHDYEGAVQAYDQIDELDPGMQSNYMKAYFLRARQLMEMGSWRAAVPHLKAAAYYSSRREGFNQLSRYWMAEAFYRDGRYGEARTILNDLYNLSALSGQKEGDLISYHMAYTYFREGDYERALKWFNNYLESGDSTQGADASTRVADCYFFRGEYETAVAAYERSMASYPNPDDLYPAYRAGVASGLLQDNEGKIRFLERVINATPTAPYYCETLYELGRAYVAVNDQDNAARTFRILRGVSTDPSMAAMASLELGTIARNQGREDEALRIYKQVVADGSSHAEDALMAIESIYRSRQDPDAYLAYVNSLGSAANRTEAQKEEVYFSTAEQIYLSGDLTRAGSTLKSYLKQYPDAVYGAKAWYYLAECHRAASEKQQAVDAYRTALDKGLEGALAESALLRSAGLHYEMGSYGKAYGTYLQLKDSAKLSENQQFAKVGMMRAAFRARQWDDALKAAADVLGGKPDKQLGREARYVRAKSYLSTSRRSLAFADLQELATEPSTPEGAEACYLIILDLFDQAEFDKIQEKVYDFSGKAGGQNYWLAKAFIVLGDCFAEQGNMVQAQATFESIQNGYTATSEQDDVPDQVRMRLRKIQQL
ncbi:MAG: tetratricopeptide repeat protein [Bacteroidales bacterium]|nr:tetratricopeptide repeat protein [Bacteroidales bacterium]